MSFYVSIAIFFLLHCDEWDRVVALPRHKFVTGATLLQLGKFIAGDFIAIAGEMHRFPASNENTVHLCTILHASDYCPISQTVLCIGTRITTILFLF